MKFVKFLLVFLLALLLLASGVFAYGYWLAKKALPQVEGTLTVKGLQAPVTVYRDTLGVPHIFALSLEDVAFAQGYVTAQDRLWQMDIFRRNAQGQLSEVLGEVALPLDEKHCTYGFREAAIQSLESLDPESRHALDQYAAGVNAFIDTHRDRLPIEFHLLRYQPRPWVALDSLSIALVMAETLSSTWERDIFRGKLSEKFGSEIINDLYPTHSKYEIPLVGTDEIKSGGLAPVPAVPPKPLIKSPVSPSIPVTGNAIAPRSTLRSILSSLLWASTPEKGPDSLLDFLRSLNDANSDFLVGSNNWVVNGNHSISGKPLLANDPHLAHSLPSLWYQVHLHAPQLNVIGVSLAGAPSIIIGHNEHIAWGMTNLNPDVQDVYREQFNSGQGIRYLANGRWVDAEIREERIKIKGKPDKILPVMVTRHGPIVRRDAETAYALKWTATEPRGIGFPFLKLNQAVNWADFTTALREFYGPTQNFVYADRDGNIGFYDAGRIPIRRRGIGNVPLPGADDNYEWIGVIPFDELPHLYNPPEGIIVTANQRIAGDSYPFFLGTDWEAPYRFARIHQLLTAKPKLSREDFLKIQGDVYSEANRALAHFVIEASNLIRTSDPLALAALARLKTGNFIATPDNVETTIIEHVRWHLEETMLKAVLGDEWKDYKAGTKPLFLENQLTERPRRWLPSEFKSYDQLLMRTLEEVCRQLQTSYASSDVSTWTWGREYPLTFHHPLGRFRPLDHLFNVGPFKEPGTKLTVKQTDSSVGPSMRMATDFADLDSSYNNLTLGESGQVLSPNYSDQVTHWLEAQSFPMHFTEANVKQNAVKTLVLQP